MDTLETLLETVVKTVLEAVTAVARQGKCD